MGAIVANDANLVARKVAQGLGRKTEVPITLLVASGGVGIIIPIVKVAYERKLVGVGRILAIGPLLIVFVKEEPIGLVQGGLFAQGDFTKLLQKAITSARDGIVVGR